MRSIVVLLTLAFLFAPAAGADWEEDLTRALAMEPGEDRDALVEKVAKEAPGCAEIAAHIAAARRPDESTGVFLRKRKCADDIERPWVLVVPEGYDPETPTPLFVGLHGLVTRPEVMSDASDYAERIVYTKLARERGWMVAIPMGQKSATWFDEIGMENVDAIVRTVKRERNVDDDRVWMGGFSDGGSAAFFYAMVAPNDYGAFLSLNGHMGVGSQFAKVDTFAVNFANTPVYVMTSDKDSLYATKKMRPSIEMAIRAGARFLYRQFFGKHDFAHVHPEMKNLGNYLERHPRNPFPGRIVWETGDPEGFGLCRWFGIDAVSSAPAAPWHEDHNALVAEDRVSIGFFHDEYEGEGVKVKSVVPDSFAAKVGLAPGDVVVKLNETAIKSRDDLGAAKGRVARGDAVELVVLREDREVALSGNLPPVENYWVFQRQRRSALAKVTFSANRVEVLGSRVGAFRILIHPQMVNLDDPLIVTVNGESVFEDFVDPDPAFLIRNYLGNRDRKLLYVAEVKLKVLP